MTAARALKGPFWATPWLLQLPSGPTWQPLGLAAKVAQAHSCIAHCSPLAHDSQNHRSVAQAVGLARKPSQPSPMQRNRPPHGPPAGGGSSLRSCSRLRCVRSLRVRPFGSPSPLRGAAACCARLSAAVAPGLRCACACGPPLRRAAGPPALAWWLLRPCSAAALLCRCGLRPGPCGAPGGRWRLAPFCPSAPLRCAAPLVLSPPRPPSPVALRAAAAAAAAFLIQKVIMFHPFKIPW